jgi:hypothetical protein
MERKAGAVPCGSRLLLNILPYCSCQAWIVASNLYTTVSTATEPERSPCTLAASYMSVKVGTVRPPVTAKIILRVLRSTINEEQEGMHKLRGRPVARHVQVDGALHPPSSFSWRPYIAVTR